MVHTLNAVFRFPQAASSAFENAVDAISGSMGAASGKKPKPPKTGVPTDKSHRAHVRSNALSVCSGVVYEYKQAFVFNVPRV